MGKAAATFALIGGLAAIDYVPDGQFEKTSDFFNAVSGFGNETVDAVVTIGAGTINLGKRIMVGIDNRVN